MKQQKNRFGADEKLGCLWMEVRDATGIVWRVLFDRDSLGQVEPWRWEAACERGLPRFRRLTPDGSRRYLHREVAQAAKGLHVRHLNGDKCDCRLANLEVYEPTRAAAACGIRWSPSAKAWNIAALVDGAECFIGATSTFQEAVAVFVRHQWSKDVTIVPAFAEDGVTGP